MTPDGLKPFVTPRALETAEIAGIVEDYQRGARNARAAGFDGVELHGANGYLIDQFLRDRTNRRTDRYGGSAMNRARFLIEAAEAVVGEWDADRVGVRLSPTNPFNDMADSSPAATFAAAVGELNRFGLAYLHVVESVAGDPIAAGEMPDIAFFRKLWRGVLMGNKGYDLARANAVLRDGLADLISFAALFLANPDFPYRDSPSTIHKVLRDPAGRSDRGHIFVISYCFETLNMGNSAADGRIIGIARSAAIKRLAIRRIEKAAPAKTRRPLMIAALKFLGQVTNEIFESRVQRVARKICEHQHYFGHRAS